METTTFDEITRSFGSSVTRRSALRGLFAGAAAVATGAMGLEVDGASVKKRRKKGGKQSQQGLAEGSRCSQDGQCNRGQKLICEIPFGAGNSDRACCRGAGATCGGNLHCCTGEAGGREFQCVNGTCQPYTEP